MSRHGYQMIACVTALALSAPAHSQWSRHTIDDSSQGADGARVADVNGDGFSDIATPWEEGGVIKVYIHPGAEFVRDPWPAIIVGSVPTPEDAFFVDLDRDGAADVVSSCEGDDKTMYVHWAPPDYTDENAWLTEAIPASKGLMQWMFALALDVDDDGDADIVAGGKNGNAAIGWFECPESPRDLAAWNWRVWAPIGWLMSLEIHDVDGDETPDILYSDRRIATQDGAPVATARPGVYYFSRDGEHSWQSHRLGEWGTGELMFVAAGTAPHGRFRVAGGTKHERLIRLREFDPATLQTTNAEWPAPAGVGKPKSLAFLDVDADGVDELILSCEEAKGIPGVVAIRLHDEGSFLDISGPEGTKFDRIELVDLDGDGDQDILTCEEREGLGVIWYENPAR